MVGRNINRWTASQIERMGQMRDNKADWREIAIAVGHPVNSCQQMMSRLNNQRRADRLATIRQVAKSMRKAKPVPPAMVIPSPAAVPLAVKKPEPDFVRSSATTAKLIMDAELRARIEVLGATGGLLGDPLPGRSALDRKREGVE